MIGPADIEDMMLDYAASNTRVADRQEPEGRSDQLIGWAWWTCPVLLAFEAQKLIQLWLIKLALGAQGRQG